MEQEAATAELQILNWSLTVNLRSVSHLCSRALVSDQKIENINSGGHVEPR